jgi:endonuclease III
MPPVHDGVIVARLKQIVSRLRRRYGKLPTPPSDAFTLFVWQILWNHSTPAKRDAALGALRRIGALTPDSMWTTSQRTLAECVSRAGPYCEQRLMGLKKGAELFRHDVHLSDVLKSPVPAALRRLKSLPRMTGDSTAYRMLLFAGGHAVLPVDARVARVATRLGYGEKTADFSKTARSIRQAVATELPDSVDAYRRAYVYFEHHGGVTCTETSPHCDACPLAGDCPYARSR